MDWSEVRLRYPNQIVLIEALATISENNIRTIKEMSIISYFEENMVAWKEYKKLHKNNPDKELYIFHTSKEKAEVVEQFFVGIRGQS
ncbi:hypothetical protein ACOI1C_13370 [Bacillus sp. DJP31]|uniref:hypothetical protein n=1 Tax=Bacillus sp. DJP31 TaxID=3409789 RepID=UPI003BB63D78